VTDIVLDCTELCANPVRTGIQRVVRELLRNWPAHGPAIHAARFVAGNGLVRLPPRTVRLLKEEEPGIAGLPHVQLVRHITDSTFEPATSALPKGSLVFIPEVFYDSTRCAFYEDLLGAREMPVALLAYDFLPFLRPELFGVKTVAPLMPYLRLVRSVDDVGHISNQTREDYMLRVLRGRGKMSGPVLPLGADGLRLERQSWAPDRRTFVALGSLDGRKNQHFIVAAFMKLWQAGHEIPLTLIGRAFEHLDLRWLTEARCFPNLRWLDAATDEDVSQALRNARGTIYVSETEGFGLPPVESLSAGIPVITLARVPSVAMLPPLGQLRLDTPNPEVIANAVLRLMDDSTAAALWTEAASLTLPSWRDFAAATSEWLSGVSRRPMSRLASEQP
jgi:glycosyltransferase involved in cell wall biosynthesis